MSFDSRGHRGFFYLFLFLAFYDTEDLKSISYFIFAAAGVREVSAGRIPDMIFWFLV